VKLSTGTKGNIQVIQILFQTPSTVPFRDVSRNTVGSVDAISSYFFEFKREVDKYSTGQDVKGNSILPNSKLFKPSIDIFSFHEGLIS
jgi:hypothetical protein